MEKTPQASLISWRLDLLEVDVPRMVKTDNVALTFWRHDLQAVEVRQMMKTPYTTLTSWRHNLQAVEVPQMMKTLHTTHSLKTRSPGDGGTTDAEIGGCSPENPELLNVFSIKPWACQNNYSFTCFAYCLEFSCMSALIFSLELEADWFRNTGYLMYALINCRFVPLVFPNPIKT